MSREERSCVYYKCFIIIIFIALLIIAIIIIINYIYVSSLASDLHENVSVTEEKMKLLAGNGAGVGFGFPHSLSQQKILSPSASLRSRPQSFAQKLRSTSKSVKGIC